MEEADSKLVKYVVIANIEKNCINISIQSLICDTIAVKKVVLYNDGKVVKTVLTNKLPQKIKVEKPGTYVVCVVSDIGGKEETRSSHTILYYDKQTVEKYKKALRENELDYEEPVFYHLPYPFSEFAMIMSSEGSTMDLPSGFSIDHVDNNTIVYSGKNTTDSRYVCYSGYSWDGDCMYYGVDEVGKISEDNPSILTGQFSFAKKYEQGYLFGTDFFGMDKIYYFEKGTNVIVSNSFHLLLIIIKNLGIELEINEKIFRSRLSSNLFILSQCTFSRNMLFKGIKILSPDYNLYYGENGLTLIRSPSYELLNTPSQELDRVDEYNYLCRSISEIKNNLRGIINSEYVDKMVFDVTGGLDSRMVLAAAINARLPFEIFTLNSGNDAIISRAVSQLFGLTYWGEKKSIKPIRQSYLERRSRTMGTYFNFLMDATYDQTTIKKAKISGTTGEQYSRWYLGKDLKDTYLEKIVDLKTFVEEYIKFKSRERYSTYCDKSEVDNLITVMVEELSLIPGSSNIQKLEKLFSIYYDSFHMLNQYGAWENGVIFSPIQSKQLCTLFLKTAFINGDYRIGFNIVNLADPILGALEYGDANYNQKYDELRNVLHYMNPHYVNLKIRAKDYQSNTIPISDLAAPCQDDKNGQQKPLSPEEIRDIIAENQSILNHYLNFPTTIYQTMSWIVSHYPQYYELLLPVYIMVDSMKEDSSKMIWVYGNLISIIDQLSIMEP